MNQINPKNLIFHFLLLICLFLGSCNRSEKASTENPTNALSNPSATISKLTSSKFTSVPKSTETMFLGTATSSLALIETPKPPTRIPISTKTAKPTAKPSQTPIPEFTNKIKKELLSWLVQAWKTRQDLAEIRAQLVNDGWIIDERISGDNRLASPTEKFLQSVDLDGDGKDEWVVTLLTKPASCFLSNNSIFDAKVGGELWIIGENGLEYELGSTDKMYYWGAPVAIYSGDITGDGLTDLVTKAVGCGAHTRLGMYHVISFRNGHFVNIVIPDNQVDQAAEFLRTYNYSTEEGWESRGILFPTPSEEISDVTGDGMPDLILHGGTFGSAGAGDVRFRTEVWSRDRLGVTLVEIQPEVTNERIDILYDANFAFNLNDIKVAKPKYERVINDVNLADNLETYRDQNENDIIRIFAAFRLVLISLIEKNGVVAQEWRDWLFNYYPDSPITDASKILVENWNKTRNIKDGCKAVTDYLVTIEGPGPESGYSPVTGYLSDAGYALKSIWAKDVCPLRK